MKKRALKIGISMSVVLALLGYDNVLRLTDGQHSQKSTGSQEAAVSCSVFHLIQLKCSLSLPKNHHVSVYQNS